MGCINLIFSAIFFLELVFLQVGTEPVEDKEALLDFIQKIPHSRRLNWDESSSPCGNWTGVTCNHDKSRVITVRLPGYGFRGPIPSKTLGRLSALQLLSLRSNQISAPFPSDFSQLENLNSLYLQFNAFSGPLPLNFSVWKDLSVINLSNNGFNGSIPSSLANLTHLEALNLANNSFSGEIPALNVPSLQVLDLSNNNLTGNIPRSLQRFASSAFSGNNLSTENSAPPLPPVPPTTAQPSKKSKKLSEPAILGIIIGGCALGFLAVAVLLIVCNSGAEDKNGVPAKTQKKNKEESKKKSVSGSQEGNGRLSFFEGCNFAFDLEDLLRASAEVLGKGTFGTTYRAALEDSTTVVVKRLKEVGVARREFEQQMEIVGSIRHENVAALRAYYYSKDEKLVVYDYYSLGSVSALLHAKSGEHQTPLDWETRLRIAIGAARGIAHIHSQNGGKLIHGNIKSSNIFLNSQQCGCVSDLGLATLMSPMTPPLKQTAGYRAPEVTDPMKVSQASDVYSYGVLLLELLTGKSPTRASGGEEVVHLVRWVHSVVREEWTAEVFDVELLKLPNIEEEMVEMLQIGLACASRMPEQRPKMTDIVRRVEDIRHGNRPSSEQSERSTPTLTPPEMGDSSVSK
ncbi:probable inactive receptor kinase At4g23740 [Diospyros lotus]|uniref:probable inactive receptor kinase At4g23740 n=1 Tax=Diospyros lotus TaxID=55363 RepID=UPI002255395B|nr:probable inactive receptor kinase At4g23740 [Diospyros lotus]XP_052186693.1 probable inactive receptor kinase At4g23740 [Diospyros lotus]XP_052186694.1 probable inactive receptor kinase At4g23740 [Diospyros lotus]